MSQKALQSRWLRTPRPRGPTPRKRDLGREGFWEWSMEPVQARGEGCPPGPPRARPTRVLQSLRVASSHMHRAVMTDEGLRPRGPGYTPRAAILALWSARRRGLRRLPSSARRSRRAQCAKTSSPLDGGSRESQSEGEERFGGSGGRWGCVCGDGWAARAREVGGMGGAGGLPLETD